MLYYKLRNGNIVDEYDIHKAFEICTGETYRYDSKAYSKWLYSMLGKSIIKAMTETEVDIAQFLKGNNTIAAVRLYRDTHGCTLREAKDAIDAIKANMMNERCNANGS
jgi:ribosomal protein L7/L12